ncbi:MAG: SAM-dependent chlorinase/fluorinase [Ignavibacteriales bacterium]|nr:SAM-dependent chlorinase/fluorinase [Ignavibacteriales bacterium]
MPEKSSCVGLLTDFGLHDHYVGVMKAVIESVCPGVRIIDITHEVESQNVCQGAYLLWASYKYFPADAIIVAVVDPGVGSHREIIGVKTNKHTFLAPKNGLLDLVLWEEKVTEATSIRIEKASTRSILPRTVSPTFHGRDIFAPLAAHLVRGTRLESLGPKTHVDAGQSPFVEREFPGTSATVLHVDRFGNVVTNIRSDLPGVRSRLLALKTGKRLVQTWVKDFKSIPPGKACLIVGSSGLVEIVMNRRSAASYLGLKQTDTLHLE